MTAPTLPRLTRLILTTPRTMRHRLSLVSLLAALLSCAGPTLLHAQHAQRDTATAIRVKQSADSITLNPKLNLRSKRALARLNAAADSLAKYAGTAYRVDTVVVHDTVLVAQQPAPAPVPAPSVFKHPFGPDTMPNGAKLAEFPRVQVDTTAPQVLRVIRTANLNAALDTARDGDEIRVPVGAKLTVEHRATKHAGWVTVRTDIPDALIAGKQMTRALADSLNLASIVTTSNTPGLWLHDGASHIRFLAVKVEAGANLVNALAWIGNNETTVGALPSFIGFDRVLFDGLQYDLKRCLRADGANVYVINSSLLGCKGNQGDSQGILVINGQGPFLFANNRIEGGHQGIFFGGGDPSIPNGLPRDAVIARNVICRPMAWKNVWQTKTIVEFKIGERILVEGNTICNVWVSGQTGMAFNVKTVNQYGGGTQAHTSDITIRSNRIACAVGVFSLFDRPDNAYPALPTQRITIYNNRADSINVVPCDGGGVNAVMLAGVSDVVLKDNWIANPGSNAALYVLGVSPRFVLQGNTIGGQYGIHYESGTAATLTPNGIYSGNVIVPWGTPLSGWPAAPVAP